MSRAMRSVGWLRLPHRVGGMRHQDADEEIAAVAVGRQRHHQRLDVEVAVADDVVEVPLQRRSAGVRDLAEMVVRHVDPGLAGAFVDIFAGQVVADPACRLGAVDAIAEPHRVAIDVEQRQHPEHAAEQQRVEIGAPRTRRVWHASRTDCRALIVDLHTPQLQGFFNIPVDHLFASPVLVDHFRKLALPNLTVVSPDAGGVERARFFAKKVDAALAIVDKRRVEINVAEVMHVIGDVNGRTCLIIDDLIDTAGTLVKTAEALVENGATSVYACASHAVLSGPAVENITNSIIKEVVVTNTIPLTAEADAARTQKGGKISVLSIAGLIGRAIQANHEETSVSKLFT